MNKTAIKNFAIWARNKLIADIGYRAGLMGITEKGIANALPQSTGDTEFYDIGAAQPYPIAGEAIHQRKKLVEVIRAKEKDTDYKTAYQYIIEEVAYTWFNRLIAVRFMEVNDYLPSHIRVLSSESGKLEPDLVTTPFDANLSFTPAEEAELVQLKQDNKLDEAFRLLFIKQCNALNEMLPALFEKTKDYTELMLNLSVIDQEGMVYHLTHDIPEDDFNIERGGQVEIIGWLYQYYNTEPKAAAFAKKEKITKEEIPAVTQLFTPDWIVRYMVENSLGRLWLEGHPDSNLKENWKYYLEEAQQEPEVQVKLTEIRKEYAALTPEDIKLIDPCMGSGHILVYAFDVLMQIYTSVGYSERDAAKSILEHNIYGLDIDDRAYQLAYFAVMMKARQYNRRILNGENTCHVYAIQESNMVNRTHLKYFGTGLSDLEKNTAQMQISGLLDTLTDAKEYGSILNVENYNWELLRRFVAGVDAGSQITMDSFGVDDTAEQLGRLIYIGETMARKYWVTVTNPPYAGTSNLSAKVNNFVKKYYPDSKADLFAVFIEHCHMLTRQNGYQAMITMHGWMFINSLEKLRIKIFNSIIVNMAHLGTRAFEEISGEVVQTSAFVINKVTISEYKGCYCRLVNAGNQKEKEEVFLSRKARFYVKQSNFGKIPGIPVAYWISENFMSTFERYPKLGEFVQCAAGISTGDNDTYLRLWYEVAFNAIAHEIHSDDDFQLSGYTYAFCNKGGGVRNWYGNNDYIANWKRADEFHRNGATYKELLFIEGITWSEICLGNFSARYYQKGQIFDHKSPGMFPYKSDMLQVYLGLLNSKVVASILHVINPTISTGADTLRKVPVADVGERKNDIDRLVVPCISFSRVDWDSFETSWDFKKHPLLRNVSTVAETFSQWEQECNERFNQLKANEEELNRIFIDIYGLQDELTPEVEDKDVTVRKADLQRDIKSLLSYAVGCMFGRYSLDVEGLAYAGGEWDSSKYKTFIPDEDNVIPITDEEYLDDDIVARLCNWLKVVYGEDTLEANLDFIAKALGNKGNTSREIIRNYFLNDFFKDHCQTYSVTGSGKRPIYWLFDSGKQNGFKALIYLHRYTPDTIGNLRIDYLHKMQRVYESEIERMQDMIDHSTNAREVATATKRKDKLTKQLKECRDYDEKISHLALSRIELDLDDGVKVNYRKLQTAYDGKFYEVLADSKNIMVKQRGKV